MTDNNLRKYEVSLWTLQDSFITVLKGTKSDHRGRIQEPELNLKNDGTEEFSFKIPMYYYEGPNRIENPNWYNALLSGNLLVGMRKIKIIFNKGTELERVFEFLITKVTENHENDELTCEVECEGLAFHELGKIGYKIELSQDDYVEEWGDWSTGPDKDNAAAEPLNNIDYWIQKILKDTNWTYSIQMDWSAHDGYIIVRDANGNLSLAPNTTVGAKPIPYSDLTSEERDEVNSQCDALGLRRHDKVYEDEYVAAWNTTDDFQLEPARRELKREKYRLLDQSESNIYNLSQNIAETFEVFCRYEYHHDENYHIVGRELVFYNNFLQESTGDIDLTYPYSTNHITREMDSTDLVTKMFVKTLNDENMESGWASIMDTDANKSGEDYLLNFDYLHLIGTITEEQYKEIEIYEAKLHALNAKIKPLSSQLVALNEELTEVSAEATIHKNALSLDDERISAADDLLNNLTEGTGELSVTAARPEICYIIDDRDRQGVHCINIYNTGIIQNTIHIYASYDSATHTLSNEITGYSIEIDEYGNLTGKIYNMPNPAEKYNDVDIAHVYVVYTYRPSLYYENIKRTWEVRKANDAKKYADAHAREVALDGEKDSNGNRISDGKIQEIEKELQDIYDEKERLIKAFERMMGPALREGNWQPEDDYAQYGDKYCDSFALGVNSTFMDGARASFGWDSELFDDEQKNYYEYGPDQQKIYYPCIDLTNYMDRFTNAYLDAHVEGTDPNEPIDVNSLSFIFQDLDRLSIEDPSYFRYLPINSQCKFAFLRPHASNTGAVKPVLMILGAEDFVNGLDFQSAAAKPRIGYLKISVNPTGNKVTQTVQDIVTTAEVVNSWVANPENYDIVYPRIQIDSGNVKDGEDELSMLLDGSQLQSFSDYSVLTRGDTLSDTQEYRTRYYLTIDPDVIFRNGGIRGTLRVNYTISNTGLIIYLDALKVLKENAFPKVEYTIDTTLVNPRLTMQAYNSLCKIVHINDYELKFENTRGYISEIKLDLDTPEDDSYTITNYKTKFEDLFSTIVAQTEDMKKNGYLMDHAASMFSPWGTVDPQVLQDSMLKADLNYYFNQGKLTISEKDGIWGISDEGVVAFRGGGIFTATQKDENGDWIWNTGILPSGINADLITSGQIDTNLIRIYAGSDLKFQLNGTGLYAYKSWFADNLQKGSDADIARNKRFTGRDLIPEQYVVHNSEGLFLVAKAGALLPNKDGTEYLRIKKDVNRVEISWEGMIIRDWEGKKVFFADTEGNLTLEGTLYATSLYIGSQAGNESIDEYTQGKLDTFTQEVLDPAIQFVQDQMDGKVDTYFYNPEKGNTLSKEQWQASWSSDGYPLSDHLGDIWFNEVTYQAYRFMPNAESGAYEWQKSNDTGLLAALADAARAQDTADGKRRVFVKQPVPPYDEGDLWVHRETTTEPQDSSGIIDFSVKDYLVYYCTYARKEGDYYNSSDWEIAQDESGYKGQIEAYINTSQGVINFFIENTTEDGFLDTQLRLTENAMQAIADRIDLIAQSISAKIIGHENSDILACMHFDEEGLHIFGNTDSKYESIVYAKNQETNGGFAVRERESPYRVLMQLGSNFQTIGFLKFTYNERTNSVSLSYM